VCREYLILQFKCKKAPGCPVEYVNLDGLRVLYTRLMKDDMSLLNSWLDGPKENYVNIEKMDGTCKTYSNRLWNCGHSGFYYWRNPLGNVENGIRPNAVRLASQLYPEKHDSDIKFLAALGREIDDLVYYQEKFSNPGLLRETLRPNKVDLSGDIK